MKKPRHSLHRWRETSSGHSHSSRAKIHESTTKRFLSSPKVQSCMWLLGKGSSTVYLAFNADTEAPSNEKGKESEKPMYLKDYERKRLLERGR